MSLSFLICKINTFIDSIYLLSVLGSGHQETNEIACLQGPPGLVEETDVKSETHGGSSKSTSGGDQLSRVDLGRPQRKAHLSHTLKEEWKFARQPWGTDFVSNMFY